MDITHYASVDPDLLELLNTPVQCDVNLMHVLPELFPQLVVESAINVGYTVWETDRLPSHWPSLFAGLDKLLVPCEFNRSIFQFSGGPDVAVIPHIAQRFPPQNKSAVRSEFRKNHCISDTTWVFYSINAWVPRKAILETLHAYCLAFEQADDVCLILKTDSRGQDPGVRNQHRFRETRDMVTELLANYPDPPRLILIDRRLTEQEMDDLHAAADCYFSLTHGEGWGLGAFDAATVGNPVIITGWGGQLDYLPAEYAFLVEYDLGGIPQMIRWESYESQQNWAVASIGHALELLTYSYSNQQLARDLGIRLQANIESRFRSEQVAKKLGLQIESLVCDLKPPKTTCNK